VRAWAMGMEAERDAGMPAVGAGPSTFTPACEVLRRRVACRIIDRAVAGPAAPWHDGRERGKRMNRRQNPTSGLQVRGARP
jgi:hypothetical protein